jgi:hypothetical protein
VVAVLLVAVGSLVGAVHLVVDNLVVGGILAVVAVLLVVVGILAVVDILAVVGNLVVVVGSPLNHENKSHFHE